MIKMRKKQNLLFVFTIVVLFQLSSCYVTKEYQRPELSTDNLYRTDMLKNDTDEVIDSVSLAEISWKQLFADELLQEYIQTALDNNLDIRIAFQNIEKAAAFVKQGKAAFQPVVTGSLDYSRTKNGSNTQAGKANSNGFSIFQLGAAASWEADIWGKLKSQDKAFTASYFQSIEAHKAVKTRLIANVASIYYQLTALTEQMSIAQRTIISRDSSLLTTRALKQAGQVTEVAVKQTEAQLYDAQLILLSLKQQERVLENAFCFLLNEPPHAIERHTLDQQQVSTSLLTGVPAELLANRPDVRQMEYGLISAFEETNIAKTNFYPQLTITASGGLQSTDLRNWFNGHSLFGNIAGGLLQPILARRQIRTAYEVAEAQQQQALLAYEQSLLNAGNEVSNALYDYHTQTETIALEAKQFDALNLAVNYSEQLLLNGLANYLEVLTARQNVLNNQLNLVNARYLRLNSIVDLYEALGGGWR